MGEKNLQGEILQGKTSVQILQMGRGSHKAADIKWGLGVGGVRRKVCSDKSHVELVPYEPEGGRTRLEIFARLLPSLWGLASGPSASPQSSKAAAANVMLIGPPEPHTK